jgi:hypothetical protein
MQHALASFSNVFQTLEENKTKIKELKKSSETKKTNKKVTKFKQFNFEKRNNTFGKYTMPLCHYEGHNLWLLKATHLNRGRGIHVFNNITELKSLIEQYC